VSSLGRKFFPVPDVGLKDFIREACVRASRQYRPRPYRGRVTFFRHNNESVLFEDQDPTAWRRLVLGELIEHVVNMHDDQGRVTDETVQSAYNEIATKLSLLQLGEVERQAA
jgi:hypothetical protein